MNGSRAKRKDANISVVTTCLVKLVLDMSYNDRSKLLKRVEAGKLNIAVVTERLLKFILRMPYAERQELLDELEEGISKGKRGNTREAYFTDVVFVANGKAFKGFIKNISADGVFVETSQKFSAGQQITLAFALPNSEDHIKITGRIARTLPWGFGVQFNEAIRDFLRRYYRKKRVKKTTKHALKKAPPKAAAPNVAKREVAKPKNAPAKSTPPPPPS